MEIRQTGEDDRPACETLYGDAFPDEDLVPLLIALHDERPTPLSLVATVHGSIVGHIAFTLGTIADTDHRIALLGPLAVAPAHQRQGIGGALIGAGLDRLRGDAAAVLVLGDPAYYGRHGFAAERAVTPPYPLPAEWAGAWQSLALSDAPLPAGPVRLPAPWMNPALWGP